MDDSSRGCPPRPGYCPPTQPGACPPRGPRLLTAAEANRTLAHRLIPRVDRLRQFSVRFGLRPYVVQLVWTSWSGSERGEGVETEVLRIPILPVPRVTDLSPVALDPRTAGILPTGSIRVDQISGKFTRDELLGHAYPRHPEDRIPGTVDFFWEVAEDGRGRPEDASCAPTPPDPPCLPPGASGPVPIAGTDPLVTPARAKYRPSASPFRDAGNVQWTVLLERVSEDRARDGESNVGRDHLIERGYR